MGPELFHELLQNINGCIMLAYAHIKDVIHLKIKLDEWYMVINYSFALSFIHTNSCNFSHKYVLVF